jgi:O-antigen ligase
LGAKRQSSGALSARALFFAVLALAPLPLASNKPWAWSALALAVGLACTVWGLHAWRNRAAIPIPHNRSLPFALAFGAYLAWCALQASPLLPEVWASEVWSRAAVALDRDLAGRVAVDPSAAIETAMRLLAYAGVFWLSLHFSRDSGMARRVLWVAALSGFAYAAYGLAVHLSGSETILWFDKWHYVDSLTSTFVNRNNYATYAGLTVLTCLTLAFDRATETSRGFEASPRGLLVALDRLRPADWFLAAAVVVAGTALLLSQSRGGFVACLAGVLAFALSVRRVRGGSRLWTPAAICLVLGAGVLLAISGGDLAGRLGDPMAGSAVERRGEVYALTARQIAEHPWLGIGPGGFDNIYQAARTDAFGITKQTFLRAHNSFLEVALEAGLPAFLLLMALLSALLLRCLRGAATRRRNAVFPCLGVGATALVATHSLIDFSLQIPAVSVTYAALMGTAVAQSWRRGRHVRGPSAVPRDAAVEASLLPRGGQTAAQDRLAGEQA